MSTVREYSAPRLAQRVHYLAAALIFGAVFLRTLIIYQGSLYLQQASIILVIWSVLAVTEPGISNRWSNYFPIYLTLQTALVFWLIVIPGFPDFLAALLIILSMQVMLRLNSTIGWFWICLCAISMVILMEKSYGVPQAIALSFVITAANIFFGSYTLAIRKAQTARTHNQTLAADLQDANHRLGEYTDQLQQLAATRERNRLARELHDSVTQSVFSMTLAARSAQLLLARDPNRVREQLDRLDYLTRSALSEMQVLISELRPETPSTDGFVNALRQYLVEIHFLKNLSVNLHVEGDQVLEPHEEQSLFRITQEALNNIVKHAQVTQASIQIHLVEPFWIEIADRGSGFDLDQAKTNTGVGLSSMRERAAEIGWQLHIITSLAQGTSIRVEKPGKEV